MIESPLLWYVANRISVFSELNNGIAVYDENGEFIGNSKRAAVKAITQVVTSRITIAAPGMCKLLALFQSTSFYSLHQFIATCKHSCLEKISLSILA